MTLPLKATVFTFGLQETLLKVDDPNSTVLSVVPPPQLHLLIGCVNHLYEILRRYMVKVKIVLKNYQWAIAGHTEIFVYVWV